MGKIAIAVHGGAGPDSAFIKANVEGYIQGLEEAVNAGYKILERGGSALDAVEASVKYLEDNPLFNAGKGSVLNESAEVEMEASIMNGKDLSCGAVATIQQVKNPVTLARAVMEKSKHIYLVGGGAVAFAQKQNIEMRPPSYFVTEHNYEEFEKVNKEEKEQKEGSIVQPKKKDHGTVGAVALDSSGNLAAATSTGGLENKAAGRVGDSSIIGVGSYANNKTCAVSCTGDGEHLIQQTCAFHLYALMEYKALSITEASTFLIHEKCKNVEGDMGLIAVSPKGDLGIAYNSERMHRGWRTSEGEVKVFIYEEQL